MRDRVQIIGIIVRVGVLNIDRGLFQLHKQQRDPIHESDDVCAAAVKIAMDLEFLDRKEGATARVIREAWERREHNAARGARFVNHYENHDIATNMNPRRERLWGAEAVDQVLVWMFTADGVPLIFNGNEIADDDGNHSMFGKTPIDWGRADSPAGRARMDFVRRLAALRATRRSLTDCNGKKGMKWLDNSAEEKATAFRRTGNGVEKTLVVQNWTGAEVEVEVPGADFGGAVLMSRRFSRDGVRLRLGAFGFAVVDER